MSIPYLYNKPLDGQAINRLEATMTPKTARGCKQNCTQQGVTECNDLRGISCAMWGLTLQRRVGGSETPCDQDLVL